MVNSSNGMKNLITPEKAASFIPVFISAGISIILIIFFVIPQYFKSTKVNLELVELIRKKNDLENLKSQYAIINKKFDKLSKEKLKIIEIVTGESNLDTLLAKLGETGKRNNIEFDSIVPKKISKYLEKNPEENKVKTTNDIQSITDPLLVQGAKKYLIEITFKTNFVNLLSFLRDLEFQDSVILINNIGLRLISESSNKVEIDDFKETLEVKISTTFYGKS